MASIIQKMRKQTAVYWGSPVSDGAGKFTFADPVEIACRWDDDAKEFLDPGGVRQVSAAVVYCDRLVDLGGYLMLGTLDDLDSATEEPYDVESAHRIAQRGQIPNMKATEFLYPAYLL